ncbi:MAG: AmmeMemoRadiSam system protein B [Deltaproteobacteria bacterium]|nr:MAG: AmmeMemoRadiSam system protein B [Deltaproteobacteria bacterium]
MPIRKTRFAGTWYPDDPGACAHEIETFLSGAEPSLNTDGPFVGGIVPHAGWYFSGSIACNVIHRLVPGPRADTILVFGMHMPPDVRPVMMPDGAWETPLGPVPVDTELAAGLQEAFPFHLESPARFLQDNTIELQMPFIKHAFPDSRVLAMGVPFSEEALKIAEAAVRVAAGQQKQIRVIGSTDLTHYGPNYGFTPKGHGPDALTWVKTKNDARFIAAVLAMAPRQMLTEAATAGNACCAGAAAAAMTAGIKLGSEQALLYAYATSADKQPGDSFVGYAGILF